jgi:hypothetical protein
MNHRVRRSWSWELGPAWVGTGSVSLQSTPAEWRRRPQTSGSGEGIDRRAPARPSQMRLCDEPQRPNDRTKRADNNERPCARCRSKDSSAAAPRPLVARINAETQGRLLALLGYRCLGRDIVRVRSWGFCGPFIGGATRVGRPIMLCLAQGRAWMRKNLLASSAFGKWRSLAGRPPRTQQAPLATKSLPHRPRPSGGLPWPALAAPQFRPQLIARRAISPPSGRADSAPR